MSNFSPTKENDLPLTPLGNIKGKSLQAYKLEHTSKDIIHGLKYSGYVVKYDVTLESGDVAPECWVKENQ